MVQQAVVRTYPKGYYSQTWHLQEYLNRGYRVVLCNKIENKGSGDYLEYIVEKEDELKQNKF